jgi:hypothetical protein
MEGIGYVVWIHIVSEEGGRSAGEGKVRDTREGKKRGETTVPLVLCLEIFVLDSPVTSDPSVRAAEDHT